MMTKSLEPWVLNDIDQALMDLAWKEDLSSPPLDATTHFLLKDNSYFTKACLVSKEKKPILFCGMPLLEALLKKFAPDCKIQSAYEEGDPVEPAATLCTLEGPAAQLLMLERTLLNFLQRLCAIATLTKEYVKAVAGTSARILDTRKTTPGWRHLEKYAVHCGGGVNHRMGLYDAIMIKDTHCDALGGLSKALQQLPQDILKQYPVIVEIRTEKDLHIALEEGTHRISRLLLDNMSLDALKTCVNICNHQYPTEASGNVDLHTVNAIAQTGVDFISVGKITHSAGVVDLSMKCEV